MTRLLPLLLVLLLAACAGAPKKPGPGQGPSPGGPAASPGSVVGPVADCRDFKPYPPAVEDPSTRGDYVAGGLYKPGVRDSTPDYLPNVACIPEPRVVDEPRSRYGNRSPYAVLGRNYHVLDSVDGFVETGLASYYGNKFHGRRTSNHEVYDMYAFTAAHKSLPLPSFARVTNLDNGRSVVVRVNDRGPFHEGRVIDLSYAAAVRLDIHRQGTGRVEVRALRPGEDTRETLTAAAPAARPAAPAAAEALPASGLDHLVGSLPTAPASATVTRVAQVSPAAQAVRAPSPVPAATAPAPAPAPAVARGLADHPGYGREEDRFRLVDDQGRVRSADEFDTWMKARQARIDAARAAAGTPAPAATPIVGAPPTAAPAAVPTPVPAPAAAPATPVAAAADAVTLQVGVFSVRDNAERALATLQRAGIASARLQDAGSNGRPLWRVRVGPVAAAALAELSSRVSGLGFGAPQIVRD